MLLNRPNARVLSDASRGHGHAHAAVSSTAMHRGRVAAMRSAKGKRKKKENSRTDASRGRMGCAEPEPRTSGHGCTGGDLAPRRSASVYATRVKAPTDPNGSDIGARSPNARGPRRGARDSELASASNLLRRKRKKKPDVDVAVEC